MQDKFGQIVFPTGSSDYDKRPRTFKQLDECKKASQN
jgi:hypothetical protein